MTLRALISAKRPVLLDGAIGTELERLGVDTPAPLWSAAAVLHAPHQLRNIHYFYLHAGADIITTTTFRTNVRTLRAAGLEDRHEELTLRAVEYAFEARDRYRSSRPVLIAGGMGPVEDCFIPDRTPPDDELRAEHAAHAAVLAESGVDFLFAETVPTVREAAVIAQVCAGTGRDFAISFVCDDDGRMLSGETVAEAVRAVEACEPAALLVNCVSVRSIGAALSALRAATALPVGFYANTTAVGAPRGGAFDSVVEADEFADTCTALVADGAAIVGGCCGTTPDHIRALATRLSPQALTLDIPTRWERSSAEPPIPLDAP